MRSVIWLILPMMTMACGAGKEDTDLLLKPSETTTTTDTTTSTTTTTTTTTDTGMTNTTPGVGGGPYGLEGAWRAQVSQAGYTLNLTWTMNLQPDCQFEAVVPGMTQVQFPCTYTADATTLIFADPNCQDPGTYGYTVAGPVLTLSVIDEPCEGRDVSLGSTWDLVVP